MAIAVAAAVLAVIAAAFYFMTLYAFRLTVRGKKYTEEQLLDILESRGVYTREKYRLLEKEEVEITSHDNLRLRGVYLKAAGESGRTIISVHGYTSSWLWMLQFADIFLERGWNVLLVDQRSHGKSEGRYATYGYYEKYDLDRWVNWVIERNGPCQVIGIHGQSMGGSTVLEYAAINRHVKFIIAECPYSDMKELLKHQIRRKHHLPVYPLILFIDMMLAGRAGFRMRDVSPIRAVRESSIPIMFIHGKEDDFVPARMSEEMYRVKKGPRKLLLVDDAKHTDALASNRELYIKEVMSFIEDAIK